MLNEICKQTFKLNTNFVRNFSYKRKYVKKWKITCIDEFIMLGV